MKLSDWIWKRMEDMQDAGLRWKPTLKFCHQVLRLDYNAVADSIVRNGHRPAITEEQAKILWDYRFFRNLDQTERSGWHKVMEVLQQTDWGKQQVWSLSGLKMGNETLAQKLNAMYTLLCSAHKDKSHAIYPRQNPEEVATAHKLVGYCMKDEELDHLKRLALHGEYPGDLTAIRYGLMDMYQKIEDLEWERAKEMRADNHWTANSIDATILNEKGRIMRSASELYERKVQGKFPDDYREALHRERMVLHGLSQKGWDGQTKIPKPLLVKYGLAESFGKISDALLDYVVRCDLGDDTYPTHTIGHHNRIIKEQSRIGLERLEHRLFPDKNKPKLHPASLGTHKMPIRLQNQVSKENKGIKIRF